MVKNGFRSRHGRDRAPLPSGRPDKFIPEIRARILDSIGCGVPYEMAADAAGICEATLYYWLERGKNDKKDGIPSDYVIFLEELKAVEENKVKRHLAKLDANVERWQSDAWILERRWWKHFSSNAAVIEFNKKLEKMEKDSQINVEKLKNEAKELIES